MSRISAISRAGLPRATHFNTSHSRAVREYGVLRAPRERPIKRMPGESAIHPQKGDSVAPSRLFYLIEAEALARAAGSQAMFSLLLL